MCAAANWLDERAHYHSVSRDACWVEDERLPIDVRFPEVGSILDAVADSPVRHELPCQARVQAAIEIVTEEVVNVEAWCKNSP